MKNNKENQSKLDDINFDKFEEENLEENDEQSLLNKNDRKKN